MGKAMSILSRMKKLLRKPLSAPPFLNQPLAGKLDYELPFDQG